jgi:DNA polymerase-3 subunit gamma/tau
MPEQPAQADALAQQPEPAKAEPSSADRQQQGKATAGDDDPAPWESDGNDAPDWVSAPQPVADLLADKIEASAQQQGNAEPVNQSVADEDREAQQHSKPEELSQIEERSETEESKALASAQPLAEAKPLTEAPPPVEQSVANEPAGVQPGSATESRDSGQVAHDPTRLVHPEDNPARWPDTDRDADPVFWWQVTLHKLGLSGMTKTLFAHSQWAGFEEGRFTLVISDNYRKLMNETHIERLMAVLGEFLPGVTGLDYQFGVAEKTPQAWFDRLHNAAYKMAVTALSDDPFVRSLVTHYAGDLQTDTVKPAHSPLPSVS